jgi:hypothetical protein
MFTYFYFYVCSVLGILFHCVVLFNVFLYVLTVQLPPGVNKSLVKEYIIPNHISYHIISYYIIPYHTISYHNNLHHDWYISSVLWTDNIIYNPFQFWYSACIAHLPYFHLWLCCLYQIFPHFLINNTFSENIC